MIKYLEFINEAKVSEIKVGNRVMFDGNFMIAGTKDYVDFKAILKGKTGVVKSINKSYYNNKITFELDEPIFIGGFDKRTKTLSKDITLTSYQLKNVIIIDGEFEETRKKLDSGELIGFKCSKNFAYILKNIGFKKDGDYFDVSYFDIIEKKPDYVTFIQSKKAKEFKGKESEIEKFKQETRVGRVLKKLNPKLNEKEIEEFVNKFRAAHESLFTEPNIDVVTGDKILYWYNSIRYKKGGGTLNNSCMRHESNQGQLKFYAKYPDKIALAILTKEDKLWARALIWRLDDDSIYMDRIYSINEMSRVILENYALKNNMLLYRNRSKSNQKMAITLSKYYKNSYEDHPYFDTFIIDYKEIRNNKLVLYNSNYSS